MSSRAQASFNNLVLKWVASRRLEKALDQVYGSTASAKKLDSLKESISRLSKDILPSVVELSIDNLRQNIAAFSQATNKIYIISSLGSLPSYFKRVMAHEFGHWVESQLHGSTISHTRVQKFSEILTGDTYRDPHYSDDESKNKSKTPSFITLPSGKKISVEFFDTDTHTTWVENISDNLNRNALSLLKRAQIEVDGFNSGIAGRFDTPEVLHAGDINFNRRGLQTHSASHFDNGNISGSLETIRNRYIDAIRQFNSTIVPEVTSDSFLGGNNDTKGLSNPGFSGANAGIDLLLYRFGQIIHAFEDFYAHSNWIELKNNGILGSNQILDNGLGLPTRLTPGDYIPGTSNVMVAQSGANWPQILKKSGTGTYLDGRYDVYWNVDSRTPDQSKSGFVLSATALDGKTVYGLATGGVNEFVYRDVDRSVRMRDPSKTGVFQKEFFRGFSHGGIPGNTIGQWVGGFDGINKDKKDNNNFENAKKLARLQAKNEWDRLGNLIYESHGVSGLRRFADYVYSNQSDRDQYVNAYSTKGGRPLQQLGSNSLIDRHEIIGTIDAGDVERRDGIVQLRIVKQGGEVVLGSGAYLGNGYILTNAHILDGIDTKNQSSTAYFGVTRDSAFLDSPRASVTYCAQVEQIFVYPKWNSETNIGQDLAIAKISGNAPVTLSTWEALSLPRYEADGKSGQIDSIDLFHSYRADGIPDDLAKSKYYIQGYDGVKQNAVTVPSLSSYSVDISVDKENRNWPTTIIENRTRGQVSLRPLIGTLQGREDAITPFQPNLASLGSDIPIEDRFKPSPSIQPYIFHKELKKIFSPVIDTVVESGKAILNAGVTIASTALDVAIGAGNILRSVGVALANAAVSGLQSLAEGAEGLYDRWRGKSPSSFNPTSSKRSIDLSGDTHLWELSAIEMAPGGSGSPLSRKGDPGNIYGLATAVDASFSRSEPHGAILNILGTDEIKWINNVINKEKQPNVSIERQVDRLDANGPLSDLGFASALRPSVKDKLYSPNPVQSLGRTTVSRILVPDIELNGFNTINYDLNLINASNVSLNGEIGISIRATNNETGMSAEVARSSFKDIKANLLGSGERFSNSFKLLSTKLPGFVDTGLYRFTAVIDPDNKVPETGNISNETDLGTFVVQKLNGPKEGKLSISGIPITQQEQKVPLVYSPNLLRDALLDYSVVAGDLPLQRLVLSRKDITSSYTPYFKDIAFLPISGSTAGISKSLNDLFPSNSGLGSYFNDYYADERSSLEEESISSVSLGLLADDTVGLSNSLISWQMPFSHRPSRFKADMPGILLPDSKSRLRIRFRDIDGENSYQLRVYSLTADSLDSMSPSRPAEERKNIWTIDLTSTAPVFSASLDRAQQDAFSILSYEINDLRLPLGKHDLLVEIGDVHGNRRRYQLDHSVYVGPINSLTSSPKVKVSRPFVDSAELMSTFTPRAVSGNIAYISSNSLGKHVPVLLRSDGQELLLTGQPDTTASDASFSQEVSLSESQVAWAEGFDNNKKIYIHQIATGQIIDVKSLLTDKEDLHRISNPEDPVINKAGLFWIGENQQGHGTVYHIKQSNLRSRSNQIAVVEDLFGDSNINQGIQAFKIQLLQGSEDVAFIQIPSYPTLLYSGESKKLIPVSVSNKENGIKPLNPVAGGGRIAVFCEPLNRFEIYKYDPKNASYIGEPQYLDAIATAGFPKESSYMRPQVAVSDQYFAWIAGPSVYVFDGSLVREVTEAQGAADLALDGSRLIWSAKGNEMFTTLLFNSQNTSNATKKRNTVSVSALVNFVSESAQIYDPTPSKVFRVTRSGDVSQPLDVIGAFHGNAIENVDFTSSFKGILRFEAGERNKTISIIQKPNGFSNGDRTISFSVDPAPGYRVHSSPDAVIALLDDPLSYGPFILVSDDQSNLVRSNSLGTPGSTVNLEYTSTRGSTSAKWFEIINNGPVDIRLDAKVDPDVLADKGYYFFELISDRVLNTTSVSLKPLETLRLGVVFKPQLTNDDQNQPFTGDALSTIKLQYEPTSQSSTQARNLTSYSFQVRASSTNQILGDLIDIAPVPSLADPLVLDNQIFQFSTREKKPLFSGSFSSGIGGSIYELSLIDRDTNTVVGMTSISSSFSPAWSIAPVVSLREGKNSLYTRLVNTANGMVEISPVVDFNVDSRTPKKPANLTWNYINLDPSRPLITGTADPMVEVQLLAGGSNVLLKTTANRDGRFVFDISSLAGLFALPGVLSGLNIRSYLPGNGAKSDVVSFPAESLVEASDGDQTNAIGFKPRLIVNRNQWSVALPSFSYISEKSLADSAGVIAPPVVNKSRSGANLLTAAGIPLANSKIDWFADGQKIKGGQKGFTDFPLRPNQTYQPGLLISDAAKEELNVPVNPVTPIDLSGTIALFRHSSSNYSAVSKNTLGAKEFVLYKKGSLLNKSSLGIWSPLAVETISGVNQLLLRNSSRNLYQIWRFNRDWTFLDIRSKFKGDSATSKKLLHGFGMLAVSAPKDDAVEGYSRTISELFGAKGINRESRNLLRDYTLNVSNAPSSPALAQGNPCFDFVVTTAKGSSSIVKLRLVEEIKGDTYFRFDPGSGKVSTFNFDSKTGLGAKLIDANGNGLVDELSIHLADGRIGDSDGLKNTRIYSSGMLAQFSLGSSTKAKLVETGSSAPSAFALRKDPVSLADSENIPTGRKTLGNTILGDSANNTLFGFRGNDILDGGLGNDILTGKAGADIFRFDTLLNASTNVDRITDFSPTSVASTTDRIQLKNTGSGLFTAIPTTGTLAANAFVSGTAFTTTTQRIRYDSGTGNLFYDADGRGPLAAILFATLSPGLTMNHTHVMVS